MSGKKQEAVKVVLMDTQYVEADPMSFKSVVQELTGKDSSVSWIKESNHAANVTKREISDLVKVNKLDDVVEVDYSRDQIYLNDTNRPSVSMLSKSMSWKDLDRWILEVPSLEDGQLSRTESNLN